MTAVYVYGMRLIDLLVVAVVLEINNVSRYCEWEFINMGFDRSIFILLLIICYYIVYRILINSHLIGYVYENTVCRWIMCIYCLLYTSNRLARISMRKTRNSQWISQKWCLDRCKTLSTRSVSYTHLDVYKRQ